MGTMVGGGTHPVNATRTAVNWMAKQPPLSPSRNAKEITQRMNTSGMDPHDPNGLMGSQSSYSRGGGGAKEMMGRGAIHSPEAVKLTDS